MRKSDKNRKTAITVASMGIGMFCMAYAAFPLYNLFCKVTGYGGTTQEASVLPSEISDKVMTIRFNSDSMSDLPWKFQPEQSKMSIRPGENKLAFFSAENESDQEITGVATYNVTPDGAGIYFNKVECFCFTKQTLAPHEKVQMPVSFFVDPDIENDPNLKGLQTITLSYTFFKAK